MNWYKSNSAEWKEIIETVARELGRTDFMSLTTRTSLKNCYMRILIMISQLKMVLL